MLYDWVAGALSTLVLLGVLKVLRIDRRAERMLVLAAKSLGIIGTRQLSDIEKEKQLQRNSLLVAGYLLQLLGVLVVAMLGASFSFYALARFWGLTNSRMPFLVPEFSWPLLLGSFITSILLWFWWARRAKGAQYPFWQKALHRMAFASIGLQVRYLLRNIQKAEHREEFPKTLFITGLPRAGTTILLKSLYAHGDFVSQVYRDMPFILLPRQWAIVNKWFGVKGKEVERPHGDGVKAHLDGPEALDEVVWQAASKEVPADLQADFLVNHVEQLLTKSSSGSTYLSKNNALFNRIPRLREVFPKATVLCMFRRPLEQAYSLWQQHLRFQELQQKDAFALEYMNNIGQRYFGSGIEYKKWGDWPEEGGYKDPKELNFWIEQWLAAYQHVLQEQGSAVYWVSYERLCDRPETVMQQIAGWSQTQLSGEVGKEIEQREHHLKIENLNPDTDLLEQAEVLYQELKGYEEKQ